MVQYDKLSGMVYEVDGWKLRLHVTEEYIGIDDFKRQPDVHIEKVIDTKNPAFWDMVFDATVELKQVCLDYVANEEGDANESQIKASEERIVVLRALELALRPMVSKNRREVEL